MLQESDIFLTIKIISIIQAVVETTAKYEHISSAPGLHTSFVLSYAFHLNSQHLLGADSAVLSSLNQFDPNDKFIQVLQLYLI